MDPRVITHFKCQSCNHPITLDPDFSHLSEHTLAELKLPIYLGEDVNFEDEELDKFTDSGQHMNGFTLVDKSADTEKSQPLKVTTGLFYLLSSNSDIDHPLCEDCTDALLVMMDEAIAHTQDQVDQYQQLLKSLTDSQDTDSSSLELELKNLKLEEERLLTELSSVEKEQEVALSIYEKHEKEKKKIAEEEDRYWREYCVHKNKLTSMEDENRSLRNRLMYTQSQLDCLKQTNVFNKVFHIWASGHFGTINNLRLGRLPTVKVSWPEINAAWGQTVLLLSSLAGKIGLTFSKYKLVPYGSHSYIEVKNEGKTLPLYGAGGLRFLWDNKFDAGMAAFLECAAEFQNFVELQGSSREKFRLPYRISKHFIVDTVTGHSCSVKMQFNSEEQWTKALKFLLTNLKWGLTWVSSSLFKNPEVQSSHEK